MTKEEELTQRVKEFAIYLTVNGKRLTGIQLLEQVLKMPHKESYLFLKKFEK